MPDLLDEMPSESGDGPPMPSESDAGSPMPFDDDGDPDTLLPGTPLTAIVGSSSSVVSAGKTGPSDSLIRALGAMGLGVTGGPNGLGTPTMQVFNTAARGVPELAENDVKFAASPGLSSFPKMG